MSSISYHFIGHNTLSEMLDELMPGATVRVVDIAQEGGSDTPGVGFRRFNVWTMGTDLDGDVHYLLISPGRILTHGGKPFSEEENAKVSQFTQDIAQGIRLWLVHKGFKVRGGLIAMPDNMKPLAGTTEFLEFNPDSKRITVKADEVITVEDLARHFNLEAMPIPGANYIEFIGANPFLKQSEGDSFVLIGGDASSPDYGTALDNKTGTNYTVEQIAEIAGIVPTMYEPIANRPSAPGAQITTVQDEEGQERFKAQIREATANAKTCAKCGRPIGQYKGEWGHLEYQDKNTIFEHDAVPMEETQDTPLALYEDVKTIQAVPLRPDGEIPSDAIGTVARIDGPNAYVIFSAARNGQVLPEAWIPLNLLQRAPKEEAKPKLIISFDGVRALAAELGLQERPSVDENGFDFVGPNPFDTGGGDNDGFTMFGSGDNLGGAYDRQLNKFYEPALVQHLARKHKEDQTARSQGEGS